MLCLPIEGIIQAMRYYQQEPTFKHDDQLKVGILLLNLGTPEAATPRALRTYLKQFLMDRRVVEVPRLLWICLLYGIILLVRPKQSAKKYAQIWAAEGSPLLVHARKQTQLLAGYLSQQIQSPFVVELGMRYGKPSIATALAALKAQHCDRILVFPLYPQYAASSTAAGLDAVWHTLLKTRNVPAVRTIKHYHDHPAYIQALAKQVQGHWQLNGRPNFAEGEMLIMSFHGVPKFHLMQGDPYHCECHKTARLLAAALHLTDNQYQVAFQSRFGKQAWLQPYLANTLTAMGKAKITRIDVICPGFSSDCLETLEEIAIEGKQLFQSHGGGAYHYIPALNEDDTWIHAMTAIALENLQGWVATHYDSALAAQESASRQANAKMFGAKS